MEITLADAYAAACRIIGEMTVERNQLSDELTRLTAALAVAQTAEPKEATTT